MNESFWLVWNPKGRSPSMEHRTYESAETEAKRLARINRGETFIVLESVVAVCVDDVKMIDLRPEFNDGIPF